MLERVIKSDYRVSTIFSLFLWSRAALEGDAIIVLLRLFSSELHVWLSVFQLHARRDVSRSAPEPCVWSSVWPVHLVAGFFEAKRDPRQAKKASNSSGTCRRRRAMDQVVISFFVQHREKKDTKRENCSFHFIQLWAWRDSCRTFFA